MRNVSLLFSPSHSLNVCRQHSSSSDVPLAKSDLPNFSMMCEAVLYPLWLTIFPGGLLWPSIWWPHRPCPKMWLHLVTQCMGAVTQCVGLCVPSQEMPGDTSSCRSAETQWKQGIADVFKLNMSRVEIPSLPLGSAAWFVMGHHWNSQSRSEAWPRGSEEGYRQPPPPTHASMVSPYPQGRFSFSRSKTCNCLAFLEKASRDVWSASSACFVCPHTLLLLSYPSPAWERQLQSLTPSMWECIQLSVFVCFLEDLFPTNLTNYFLNTTFIFWPQTSHSNESVLELCTAGKKVPPFAYLQVMLGLFHLVPPSWETVDGNHLFSLHPFPGDVKLCCKKN